jgi:hypothetical protein
MKQKKQTKEKRCSYKYKIYNVGEDVTVIGEVRREGLRGTVVRETEKMVVIADDAGFLHWLMLEDVTRTNGVYW